MKKLSIAIFIILGIIATGCQQREPIEVKPSKSQITDADKSEVYAIMKTIFIDQNIDKALNNSFKDLKTLKKIQVALETESLDETKELLISQYMSLPVFDTRSEYLDKFQPDTIEVFEEDGSLVSTIAVDLNGDTYTTKYVFAQNERGEWYNTEDLPGLARELEIEIEE